MSTLYSVGNMNQVADALEAAGYTPDDVTKLRSRPELLKEFKLILYGLAKVVRECFKLACDKPFSPSEFIGRGWAVWKGPANGNGLEGEEDRDKREDSLPVIDWDQVSLETHLQGKETSVQGEEKLNRAIASGNILLGGKALLSLWQDYQANRENSVLEKLRRKGVTRIYFFGLRLRSPRGRRGVLCLYVDGSEWDWDCDWLNRRGNADVPSASLASLPAEAEAQAGN